MPKRGRSVRNYFPRKHRRTHRKPTAVPIIPVITGIIPLLDGYQAGGGYRGLMDNPYEFGRQMVGRTIGYDVQTGELHSDVLIRNVALWVAGAGVHALANRTINPYLKRVPLVGKYISL